MDELLAEFLTEAQESLSALDEALLKLERVPEDTSTLSVVFRLVHTIKGTCGFLALPRLERVAHAAEELLGTVRDGTRPASPALITTLLAYLDRIKHIVSTIAATGAEPPGDDQAWIASLQTAEAPPGPPAKQDEPAPELPAAESHPTAAATDLPEDPASLAQQSIRVGVDVLEGLMTLVSELVLTRNQLMQLARSEEDSRYSAPLQRLSHIVSDLQEGVMKTRMQPIRHAWSRLPRMVRDLSAELGKPIKLVMHGQDTELDRQVVELIRDPLTHMVRNSADHGLEPPDVRLAAGKSATGTITLNSYHEGGQIIIEVTDDGAGLHTARIRERALNQSLATAAELKAMTDSQIHRFIFHPGLSTASTVTAVSGRGVGMDVVKTNIERVGGVIDVRSALGSGTTFTIKIPLTLAIISALVVEAGGERFALPQICVAELVRAAPEGNPADGGLVVERIDGTPVLRLRDELLPLVQLADLLKLEAPPRQPDDSITVVVVSVGATVLGLVVDQVFDTEEIVVKPVSPLLRHINIFSGNTILGDGSVIMILDPNNVARSAGSTIAKVSDHAVDGAANERLEHTGDRRAILLVRVADRSGPMAVPLGLVARIESIERTAIEHSSGRAVTCYRGQLMPLVELCGKAVAAASQVPVLVFTDRGRSMGLVVDEIVDVVEDRLDIQLAANRPGVLGTALIGGQVTDVMDAGHWLLQAWQDWFRDGAEQMDGDRHNRVLVVEDNAFFRQLLVPTLSAAGYHVTAVDSAAKALALRDRDEPIAIDVIVSDVEMPGMDGLRFAQEIRSGGRWADIPLVALSGRFNPADISRGEAAGFADYVPKFDRNALLAAIARQLSTHPRIAA